MDTKFDKPVSNNEPGVLAMLWRKIIKDNKLAPKLGLLLTRYLESKPINNRIRAIKKKNRSTLIDNITAPEMSIKTFLYLIFKFLGAKKLDISIKITFSNNQESMHNITVENNSFELDNLSIEEEDMVNSVDNIVIDKIQEGE